MKKINTINAIGHVLCHDMTRIVAGEVKETRFFKGHVVQEQDIPVLLSMGKEHLFVWEKDENMYHENEAAEILYKLCQNPHMSRGKTREGKIEMFAQEEGLFVVNKPLLDEINSLGEMMIATLPNLYPVKKGDKLAGMRVIPLVIEKDKMEKVEKIRKRESSPLMEIKTFDPKKVGIVITGSEIASGRITDQFGPVLIEKLREYPVEVLDKKIAGDSAEEIAGYINEFIGNGADMILCTGGMSVDPDDTTPRAITMTGSEIVTYGAPVLPGAMFLLAYGQGGIPILGLPGCVMYSRRTIFDLVLPKIMANIHISKEAIDTLGTGGLCLECHTCSFPNCTFGRG